MRSLLIDVSLVLVLAYSAFVLQNYWVAASCLLIIVLPRFLKPRLHSKKSIDKISQAKE
jgi:hypothetical protein